MNEFRLNLIRDLVPAPAQRRFRYRAMIGYLALSGLLLVGAVGLASQRWVHARVLREQTQKLESMYERAHEGQGGLVVGAARMQDRLARQVAALQALEKHLAENPRPARLLRALVLSLPTGVTLRSLDVNREEQTVLFELLSFGSAAEGVSGPQDLLEAWQALPELAGEVQQISYLGSQIEGVGERSDTVWRFSGRLMKGGG